MHNINQDTNHTFGIGNRIVFKHIFTNIVVDY